LASPLLRHPILSRNALIVDEVDDTRTPLEYAVKELEKDMETAK
jgi:uncharacterized protein